MGQSNCDRNRARRGKQKAVRRLLIGVPIAVIAVLVFTAGCATHGDRRPEAEPGTIEDRQHPDMDKVINAAEQVEVSDDKFAVFYYREDENY